jgi:hypothetical protein
MKIVDMDESHKGYLLSSYLIDRGGRRRLLGPPYRRGYIPGPFVLEGYLKFVKILVMPITPLPNV